MEHRCCNVCGREVAAVIGCGPNSVVADAMLFCSDWDCQRVAQKRAQMTAESFLHLVQQHGRMKRESQRYEAEFDQSVEELVKAEEREDRDIQIRVLDAHRGIDPDRCDVVPIPSSESRLVPKDSGRVDKFRDYLIGLIDAARQFESVDQVPAELVRKNSLNETEGYFQQNPSLRVLSSHICSICRGGCCSSGGDKAHLSVDSIRQFMDEQPELSDSELVDQYLALVPEWSIADACIMQSSTGCTLPRSMRGRVCNGYSCKSLKQWQAGAAEKDSRSVVVVQRDNDWWTRFDGVKPNRVMTVALVEEGGVQLIDSASVLPSVGASSDEQKKRSADL